MTLTPEEVARIEESQREANDNYFRRHADERQNDWPTTTDRAITRTDSFGHDWRSALARHNGRIVGDERNVLLAMRIAPELKGMVRFDEFALRVEFAAAPPWRKAEPGSAWIDEDDTALQAWLQDRDSSIHPVRMFLDFLQWDGEPRLQSWLSKYLNAQAPALYLSAVGRKFLASAVARIYRPGCQVDHALVLEGAQGCGKSSTARLLGMRPEWFTDDMPDIHTKDAALQMCGRWIVELGELAAMRKAEFEGFKAFISRPVDVFRPPYGRRTITVPRQSVFIATTNEAAYLRDPTGNRRFWPVRCGRIALDALARDRDQLYAEAVASFRAGEHWHLTSDELAVTAVEQEHRVFVTEIEFSVAEFLDALVARGENETDVRDLMIHALQLDPNGADFAERATRLGTQVASAMQRCGWQRVRREGGGANRRTVYRLAAYQDYQDISSTSRAPT
jgi:putative DNA primase/helicase